MDKPHSLVGKEWNPLKEVVAHLIHRVIVTNEAEFYTYRQVSARQATRSPGVFFDARDELVHVEISGNVVCEPPLTEDDFLKLQILGWHTPTVTAEAFLDENGFGGLPNVSRDFSPMTDFAQIADEIVAALVVAYQLQLSDSFFFGWEKGIEDEIDGLGVLKRQAATEKNTKRRVFSIPVCSLVKPDEEAL